MRTDPSQSGGQATRRPRAAGVVLAGGRSLRFGSDKAEAPFSGAPLAQRSITALRASVDVIAVNGPPALAARFALPCVADAAGAARGPLAGIAGALVWARQIGCEVLLTAPCDTPFLPEDLGAALIAGLGDAPVAAARAERAHPLCAAWRVSGLDAVGKAAMRQDQPSLERFISALGGVFVAFPEEAAFANVNTPEDYAAALGRLSRS